MVTDLLFTCTTQTVATAVQLAGRQRIWRYQYDATFPNLQLFPNAGAYHTAEIPSVWGTYPTTNQFGSVTPTQIALSSYMQGAWAGFAKIRATAPAGPDWGVRSGWSWELWVAKMLQAARRRCRFCKRIMPALCTIRF